MRVVKALVIAMTAFAASETFAWRETGHWAVCEIGYRMASPRAKAAVDQLVGRDFAGQCTWPDMMRNSAQWKFTYAWHFADVEDGEDYFTAAAATPKGDAVRAILKAEDTLRDPGVDTVTRKNFLRFLGHFIGDLHQPLHVGKKADGGGNKITVKWLNSSTYDYAEILRAEPPADQCTGPDGRFVEPRTGECVTKKSEVKEISLHKAWDLHLIEYHIKAASIRPEADDSEYLHKAYATNVSSASNKSERHRLIYTLPVDWHEESHKARGAAYEGAVNGAALGEDYAQRVVTIANQRIFEAGVRLAATLDRIFDPERDQSPRAAFLALRREELKQRLTPEP